MIKYMHIERLGNDEVEGILNGTVYVFPKLDGTNGQLFLNTDFGDGFVDCASRNRELNIENTNQGFWNYKENNYSLYLDYFQKYPHHILYGEWLVPHTLKTYTKEAWNKFYVFDVYDIQSGKFIPYDEYLSLLLEFNIPFIPLIAKIENATEEYLVKFLDQNTFLVEDGKGSGEGIVIKNYDFINKYRRVCWAKLVRNEFKEENKLEFGVPEHELIPIELKIAQEFVTEGRLNKVRAKIILELGTAWRSEYIPRYLNTVWFEIITEELWNILKKFKNPKINFQDLNRFVIKQIKEIDKESF